MVWPVIAAAAATCLWLGLPSASRMRTGGIGHRRAGGAAQSDFHRVVAHDGEAQLGAVLAGEIERAPVGVGQLLGADQDLLHELVVVALRRERDAELDEPPIADIRRVDARGGSHPHPLRPAQNTAGESLWRRRFPIHARARRRSFDESHAKAGPRSVFDADQGVGGGHRGPAPDRCKACLHHQAGTRRAAARGWSCAGKG